MTDFAQWLAQGHPSMGRFLMSVPLFLVAGCREPVQTAEFIFAPDGLWWISARHEADEAVHASLTMTPSRLFPTWTARGEARSTVFFRNGEGASKAIRPNTKLVWDDASTFDGLGFYAVQERNLLSLHRLWCDPVEGAADPFVSSDAFSEGLRPLTLACLELAVLMRGEELTNDDGFQYLLQKLVALVDSTQSFPSDLLVLLSEERYEERYEEAEDWEEAVDWAERRVRYWADDITEFLALFAADGRLPSEWLESLDSDKRTRALDIQSKLRAALALLEDSIGEPDSAIRPDPPLETEERLDRLRQFRALHGLLAALAAAAISDDDGERERIAEWIGTRILDPLLDAMDHDASVSFHGALVATGRRSPLLHQWVAQGLISPSILEVPVEDGPVLAFHDLLLALQAELEIAPPALAELSGLLASIDGATIAPEQLADAIGEAARDLIDHGDSAFQLWKATTYWPAIGLVRVADAHFLNGGDLLERASKKWLRSLERRYNDFVNELFLGAISYCFDGYGAEVSRFLDWGPFRRPIFRFVENADLVETNMGWHRTERAIYRSFHEAWPVSWWVKWVTLRPQGEALLAELTAPERLAAFLASERDDPSLESLRRRLLEILGNRLLHTPWPEGGAAYKARLEVTRQLLPALEYDGRTAVFGVDTDKSMADRRAEEVIREFREYGGDLRFEDSTSEMTVLDQTREVIVGSALRSPTVSGWMARGKIRSSRLLESLIESQVLATPLNREEVIELLVEVTVSASLKQWVRPGINQR